MNRRPQQMRIDAPQAAVGPGRWRADAREADPACGAWADDDTGRGARSWHAYHLIGDVLRSDDLAAAPGARPASSSACASAWPTSRSLAASRPPAVALRRSARRAPRRTAWVMPAALAARRDGAGDGAGGHALAPGGRADSSAPAGGAPRPLRAPQCRRSVRRRRVLEASAWAAAIVRDAQLDRYLRAHREYGTRFRARCRAARRAASPPCR